MDVNAAQEKQNESELAAAQEAKIRANKQIQKLGAAAIWIKENEAPVTFTPTEEGNLKIEVGEEGAMPISEEAIVLLGEALQTYADETIDAVTIPDLKFPEVNKRADRGSAAAALASQIEYVVTPKE